MDKSTNPNSRIEVIVPSENFHETIGFNLSKERINQFVEFFRDSDAKQAYESMRILLVEEFIADLQKDGWSANGIYDFINAIIHRQFNSKKIEVFNQ